MVAVEAMAAGVLPLCNYHAGLRDVVDEVANTMPDVSQLMTLNRESFAADLPAKVGGGPWHTFTLKGLIDTDTVERWAGDCGRFRWTASPGRESVNGCCASDRDSAAPVPRYPIDPIRWPSPSSTPDPGPTGPAPRWPARLRRARRSPEHEDPRSCGSARTSGTRRRGRARPTRPCGRGADRPRSRRQWGQVRRVKRHSVAHSEQTRLRLPRASARSRNTATPGGAPHSKQRPSLQLDISRPSTAASEVSQRPRETPRGRRSRRLRLRRARGPRATRRAVPKRRRQEALDLPRL